MNRNNILYILSCGFGYTKEYWQNLVPILDGDIVFFEEGMIFDKVYEKRIGIGHSLGYLKLNNSGIQFDYMIGLQGFLNFCGKDERIKNIRLNYLDRVISDFNDNYESTVSSFQKRCGCNTNLPKNADIKDLYMMKESFKHNKVKTKIIGSLKDRIVPFSIIEDNFKDIDEVEIECIDEIGHSLGFNEPMYVLEVIREFCK